MTARDAILGRLKRTECCIDATVHDGRVGEVNRDAHAVHRTSEELLDEFRIQAELVDTTVHQCSEDDGFVAIVMAIMGSQSPAPALYHGIDEILASLPWPVDDAPERQTMLCAPDGNVGLVRAVGAISSTGSVVIASGSDCRVSTAFLARKLIVLVRTEILVSTLGEFWRSFSDPMPRHLSVMTGPSRSADIGHSLVLGAHGPVELHAVLYPSPTEISERSG